MTVDGAAPPRTSLTDWIWLSLPYVLLAGTAVYVLVSGAVSRGDAPLAIGAGAALAVWHTLWAVLGRRWLERSLLPMAVYYVGLIALCTLLLHTSFAFFTLYLISYPLAFVALPGPFAYAGLVLATLPPLLLPGTGGAGGLSLAITGAGLAFAALVGWSIRRLEAETAARRAALLDLAAAHADLERALTENLALRDRLVAEARDAGVHAERARLAAELHDTLAAALTAIVSQLEALDAEAGRDDPLRRRLRTSTELAREALREARRSLQALRPPALEGRSLPRALSEVIAAARRTHRPAVAWQVTGTPVELGTAAESALLRIAQESLGNAGRHAGAEQVHLTLSYLGDTVALDVADDGVGFDPTGPRGGGHGLGIMTERARALGGDLELRSAPGAGTTVTATLPLTAAAAGDPSAAPTVLTPGGADERD